MTNPGGLKLPSEFDRRRMSPEAYKRRVEEVEANRAAHLKREEAAAEARIRSRWRRGDYIKASVKPLYRERYGLTDAEFGIDAGG